MYEGGPAISVIMAAKDCESTIREAVDSILAQTFTDFELIVVDDGSTDATSSILSELAARDARLHVLTNAMNMGCSYTRNKAASVACAEFIAVMDADDWAYSQRLEVQYTYMREHPEVDVCGAAIEVYEFPDRRIVLPFGNADIRVELFFGCVLAHSTVILKKRVFDAVGGYNTQISSSEDYDLWGRLAENPQVVFANLPDVLLKYREWPDRPRGAYKKIQETAANIVKKKQLTLLFSCLSEEEYALHDILMRHERVKTRALLKKCMDWCCKLDIKNRQVHQYDENVFTKKLHQLALDFFRNNAPLHKNVWSIFLLKYTSFPLFRRVYFSARMLMSYLKHRLKDVQ